jgi:hypothetical protein
MRWICVALLLGGCAAHQSQWVKAGATDVEFQRDRNECAYEAKKYTPAVSTSGSISDYGVAVYESAQHESDLGALCMKTKGYELKQVS